MSNPKGQQNVNVNWNLQFGGGEGGLRKNPLFERGRAVVKGHNPFG